MQEKVAKASRREIIGEVAKKSAVSRQVADHVFHSLSEVIEKKLKEGKQVTFPYIGTFYFAEKEKSISNLTKQEIPRHKQLKFKFNRLLARYVRVMSREN